MDMAELQWTCRRSDSRTAIKSSGGYTIIRHSCEALQNVRRQKLSFEDGSVTKDQKIPRNRQEEWSVQDTQDSEVYKIQRTVKCTRYTGQWSVQDTQDSEVYKIHRTVKCTRYKGQWSVQDTTDSKVYKIQRTVRCTRYKGQWSIQDTKDSKIAE